MLLKIYNIVVFCCVLACCALCPLPGRAEVTVLLPDQPTHEEDSGDRDQQGGQQKERQMDVLLARIEPFSHVAQAMDMPQRLAVLRSLPLPTGTRAPETGGDAHPGSADFVTESEELLGDCEEIRYLDEKAWATHVALNKAGLYTLIAETRPRYDAARQTFQQDLAKTMLPVFGQQAGWYAPVGLKFEIVPRTRPFGLMAPALFSARLLLDGQPLGETPVEVMRLNTARRGLPGPWHVRQTMRTNADGEFALVCPLEGWWCFAASTVPNTSLKGPDNTDKPLELRTMLWVYVDSAGNVTHKPQRPPKGRKDR